MARRDLYGILGVSAHADPTEIKRAYRRAVFTAHPDVGERPDSDRFREIQEAYEVLSDPVRRRAYDMRPGAVAGREDAEPIRQARAPAGDWPAGGAFQSLLDEFAQSFFGLRERSAPPRRRVQLQAVLEPEEARFGCRVPLDMRHSERCHQCRGTGTWWGWEPCRRCGGEGFIAYTTRVTLVIPPGVKDGERLEFELSGMGQPLLEARITIR